MDVSLLLRPDLGKKAYKMRSRFRIEAEHTREQLNRARNVALNDFIVAMGKRDWQYVSKYLPRITGPYSYIQPSEQAKPQRISAKQMLPGVLQGNKYRESPDTLGVFSPDPVDATEWVEYEISAFFVHPTLVLEIPYSHEERGRW